MEHAEQFSIDKPQLLRDTEFKDEGEFWIRSGSGSVDFSGHKVAVKSSDYSGFTVFQTIPVETPGVYYASVEIHSVSVTMIEKQHRAPDVMLFFRDMEGVRFDGAILAGLASAEISKYFSEVLF